jgi:hypothetical protein
MPHICCGARRLREGSAVAEQRRTSKLISKLFQISACFLQTFPKKALAVLWDFKTLQGFQMQCAGFQRFRRRQPPFGRISDAAGPHFAKRRRTGPIAFGGSRRYAVQLGRRMFMAGHWFLIMNVYSMYSDFWKEFSVVSTAEHAGAASILRDLAIRRGLP